MIGKLVKIGLKKGIKMTAVKHGVKYIGVPVAKKVTKKAYYHFIEKE
ncbi:hypothetical protein [uncultured Methanobrevibacter sp.]|nr:hypothetical protein [uncultured Methanobrevibacter sp.]